MRTYIVAWSMPIEAFTPAQAVLQAQEILADPENIATVFGVREDLPGTKDTIIDAAELDPDAVREYAAEVEALESA